MSLLKKHLLFLSLIITCSSLPAQLVQWRGPERSGNYPDKGLLQEWPENGPKPLLQKTDLNKGHSSPVFYKETIYITGKKDSLNAITALTLDGTILWETIYGNAWDQSYPESRNTPTIENDRIYITSGMGTLNCINSQTGDIIWSVNAHEQFGGEFHRWGFAESVVITNDAVVSSPTGSQTAMVAFKKETGEVLWKTESLGDVRSYASPILVSHNGKDMILAITSVHALGVDPSDGTILWKHDIVTGLTEGRRNNTNTPLYHNGEIFITSGYDSKALMLRLSDDGKNVSRKWISDVLDTHHGGVVLVDGYIYGSNWIGNGNGNWVCLDWNTGKVMYEEKWHNKGQIIYADNRLYIYEEKNGNFGLVKPDPSGFKLAGTFLITEGTGPHWAHPTIFDGMLFVRHGEFLGVYDIKAE